MAVADWNILHGRWKAAAARFNVLAPVITSVDMTDTDQISSVQRQLDRFERSGALVCQRQGRTLVYAWNPKSRLAARLRDLTGVVYDGLDPAAKEALFTERRQPRAKDKPVIRQQM